MSILIFFMASNPNNAQLLDYTLGAHHDGVTYRKAELKTFVSLGVEDKLGEDELSLLGSVLEFSGKTVGNIMVRLLRWIDLCYNS